MLKQAYQKPEIRDADDNIIQEGAYGKKTAFTSATNDGVLDYISNNLEALHETLREEISLSTTLSASGWDNSTYIISDPHITADVVIHDAVNGGWTAAQYNAWQSARIIISDISDGSMTLKALGAVSTIDIPVDFVIERKA
nr:MAG TPA: hypothetical protein [Bacteriophage sp.]